MFKKLSILFSALVVLSFSSAFASTFSISEGVTPSFFGSWSHDHGPGEHIGPIDDDYTFTATGNTTLEFIFSVNHPGGPAGVGVESLVATWSDGGVIHTITDAGANIVTTTFFHTLLDSESFTLDVAGAFLENGGGYTLTVAAVPLPPAVIAFSTAMLGVGFLARRKRKKKEIFA